MEWLMEHLLTSTDVFILLAGWNIFPFLFPSFLFPSPWSLCLSWDPSSIILNSSSKPSTLSISSHYFGFMSWMSSVSFMHPSTISKVKSNTGGCTHTHANPPHPFPLCPRRVEQKVVAISSPLGHNGRGCAASPECNTLFRGRAQRSTDKPDTPRRKTMPLFPLTWAAPCLPPVDRCASFVHRGK